MNSLRAFILGSASGLLVALAGPVSGRAETSVTTAPAGFVALPAPGHSDTVLSAPLARPTVYVDTVAAVSGGTVLLAGLPGWTTNQFVRGADQPETFYLAFSSGAKAGQHFTITANAADTLTLDLAGDTLDEVREGDAVRIVPYWTFGTLFPNGAGVTATSSHGSRPTEILLFNHAAVGTNLAPAATYYYFAGTNPGWRRVGGGLSTVRDHDIIPNDAFFIFRQNTGAAQRPVVIGSAPEAPIGTVVSTLAANTAQDNFLAYAVPQPLSLSQLNLVQSGAFEGTASHGVRRDELYVFDNAVVAHNKSPSATYYYFTGPNPGWRRVGGGLNTVRDDDIVVRPGSGFIVRKAATTLPQSFSVSFTPTYH